MKTTILIVIQLGLVAGISLAQSTDSAGRKIFESNCAKCHGSTGSKGKFGAKDLTISSLQEEAARRIILNGKNIMPAWSTRLTSAEIDQVISYIFALRRRG